MNEEKNYELEDEKKLKTIKPMYLVQQLGSGVEKAYFASYVNYFYTNVYMMSAAFSGILSIIQQILGWVGTPLFGIIFDRVSFKKAKYWPWMIIGPVVYYGSYIILFLLPAFGISGDGSGLLALVLASIIALTSPIAAVPISACFPLLSTKSEDRQFFAIAQKLGRDGGKTIMGYVFPILLSTIAATSSDSTSYAVCALIAGLAPILTFALFGFVIKDSYVERKALESERTATGEKKKSIPMSVVFKTVATNRPLLSIFLFMSVHKGYYFLYVTCATYMFKYIFNDFSKMSIFMTLFNLTAIIGVMFGPLWKKIFKETKRCFVACMTTHVIILAIIALTFKKLSAVSFIALFSCSSFFMGMLENYILPMFAASSDYGAWKSGNRLDGISMSVYTLTIKFGTLIATLIRTAVLVAADLDAVTAGGAVTTEFVSTMSNLFSWYPLGLGIVALLILVFGFNLNDERINKINDDLSKGISAKESTLSL